MSHSLHLSADDVRTLDLEIERLGKTHGLKLSRAQIVSILIAQHRLKLRLSAEQEDAPDVLAWIWKKRNGEGD